MWKRVELAREMYRVYRKAGSVLVRNRTFGSGHLLLIGAVIHQPVVDICDRESIPRNPARVSITLRRPLVKPCLGNANRLVERVRIANPSGPVVVDLVVFYIANGMVHKAHVAEPAMNLIALFDVPHLAPLYPAPAPNESSIAEGDRQRHTI